MMEVSPQVAPLVELLERNYSKGDFLGGHIPEDVFGHFNRVVIQMTGVVAKVGPVMEDLVLGREVAEETSRKTDVEFKSFEWSASEFNIKERELHVQIDKLKGDVTRIMAERENIFRSAGQMRKERDDALAEVK